MTEATLNFDHVHLVSASPAETARWYERHLGGTVTRRTERKGAPQIFVAIGGTTLIIRGQREGEAAGEKDALHWGIDHFGFSVPGDFEQYCAALKATGVTFNLDPTEIDSQTRIAFIRAPDGVSIELLSRAA